MTEWTREEFESQLAREREDREPANPHDQASQPPRQMKLESYNSHQDDKYISEAGSPWERLARKWEVESRRQQLDPERRCPDEVAKTRMLQLSPLLEEIGA